MGCGRMNWAEGEDPPPSPSDVTHKRNERTECIALINNDLSQMREVWRQRLYSRRWAVTCRRRDPVSFATRALGPPVKCMNCKEALMPAVKTIRATARIMRTAEKVNKAGGGKRRAGVAGVSPSRES